MAQEIPQSTEFLRKRLLLSVPRTTYNALHQEVKDNGKNIGELATNSLAKGILSSTRELPEDLSIAWSKLETSRALVTLVVSPELMEEIEKIAKAKFAGDSKKAAIWLIVRGNGLPVRLPTPEELELPDYVPQPYSPPPPPAPEPVNLAKTFSWFGRNNRPLELSEAEKNSSLDGDNIKERRERIGLSQRELAKEANLKSHAAVGMVENGTRKTKTLLTLLDKTLRRLEEA